MVPVIGLDIGGANTKAAVVDADDRVRVASEPFEVWRRPDALTGAIASVVGRLEIEHAPVALTTTAELVDAFASKREGVLHVLEATRRALPGRPLRVITTGGQLIGLDDARAAPLECAAANWMATALLIARSVPDVILLDCGGTTTDVIPIVAGEVVARGRTDVERLFSGELVYTGALRTNVAAIVSHVPIGGRPCPVSSELFAISADAHLLRGSLIPELCSCTFPDGRGPSLAEARARLARVVCADPDQLADGDVEAIAARRRGGPGRVDRRRAGPRRRAGAGRRARDRVGAGALPGPGGGGALRAPRPPGHGAAVSPAAPERWRPRSRCRYSAVSEPGAPGGQGRRRAAARPGARAACAGRASRCRSSARAGRCWSSPAAGRSPTRSARSTRGWASADEVAHVLAHAGDGSARRAAGRAAPDRRRAAERLVAPHEALAAARRGAGVRGPPRRARVLDGHQRLAGGAGGRRDRGRGGGPAQAGRRRVRPLAPREGDAPLPALTADELAALQAGAAAGRVDPYLPRPCAGPASPWSSARRAARDTHTPR